MANSSKNKGDRAERDSVTMFLELAPDLCVEGAQRLLGAGRRFDVGDLHVFPDVAVQVRNYALASIGSAIRSAATDSVTQATNGRLPLGLGLVPYPNARAGTVRWIACTVPSHWPAEIPDNTFDFALVGRALKWLRTDVAPFGFKAYTRPERIARLTGGNAEEPVLLAPVEAWLASYARYRREQDQGRHLALVSG